MKVYFGLGTNLGDKEQNLRIAVQKIEERIGKIVSLSAFYATSPWGFQSDNAFLNAAACAETSLSANEILKETQQIEREMGRHYKSVNGHYKDRVIDIDLLLCDGVIMNEEELVLPHPLMTQRRFVMEPLAEIAPKLIHPLLGKTMEELMLTLSSSPQ